MMPMLTFKEFIRDARLSGLLKLAVSWKGEGSRGVSSWHWAEGDTPDFEDCYPADPEPDLPQLERALALFPLTEGERNNLPIKHTREVCDGYYGEWSSTRTKEIGVRDLYEYLVQVGHIQTPTTFKRTERRKREERPKDGAPRLTYAGFCKLVEEHSSYFGDGTAFEVRWQGPGRTGGDCWGGVARDFPGDPEPPFSDLEKFLTSIGVPKDAQNPPIQRSWYSPTEYYGNVVVYEIKSITHMALWRWLLDNKFIVKGHPMSDHGLGGV